MNCIQKSVVMLMYVPLAFKFNSVCARMAHCEVILSQIQFLVSLVSSSNSQPAGQLWHAG